MRKLPSIVVIRGINYAVSFVSDLKSPDGTELLGYCERDKGKIVVEKNIPNDIQWATFWHEVIHAISRGHQLDTDELFIDIIAGEIHGLLKQMKLYGEVKK